MSNTTLLRTLVVAEWLLSVLGAVVDVALESTMPAPLAAYLASESETFFGSWSPSVAVGLTLTLVISLIASVGLFFLRPWARSLYLIATILGFVILPFAGPDVMSAPGATLVDAALVVSGILLGGLYVGPFRELFQRRAA